MVVIMVVTLVVITVKPQVTNYVETLASSSSPNQHSASPSHISNFYDFISPHHYCDQESDFNNDANFVLDEA